MSLSDLAAASYINSFVDRLPITDEAKISLRSLLPKKFRLVRGLLILDHNSFIIQLIKHNCWSALDLYYITEAGKTKDDLRTNPELIEDVCLNDEYIIDNVMFVSTPDGLILPRDETIWNFPISDELKYRLASENIVETYTLLVKFFFAAVFGKKLLLKRKPQSVFEHVAD